MPQVKAFRQTQTPGAISDQTINVSVSPAQFGAPIAQGLADVAKNLTKMQEEDDANIATETFNNAAEEARIHLYEGDDAVYSKMGKNATGSHDSSKVFFEETYNKYADGLKNDNQKRAFTSMWGRRTNTNLDNVARHEATQRKEYLKNTQTASLAGSAAHAANNYDKPDEIQQSLNEIDTIIRANATGDSEEVVLNKQIVARSTIHKSVVDRMMISDPDGAAAYYDKFKDQVEGQHHEQIEKSLQGNVQKKRAQEQADKIIASDITDAQKRRLAKEEENPETRALIEGMVNQDIAREKTDRIEAERQQSEEFWDWYLENPDVSKIPEDLPSTTKRAAIKFANTDSRATDVAVWYEIYQQANDDPVAFMNRNLLDNINDLDESDFQRMASLQAAYRRGDKNKLTSTRSISAKSTKALNAVGIKSTTKVGAEQFSQFDKKLQDEITNVEEQEKRKIKPQEVDEIIDRLLLSGEVDDGTMAGFNFNDPNKYLFETEESERFFIDTVPNDERAKIIEAYNKKGIKPTEEQIVNLYTQKMIKR